jgi:hypothetical protein
MAFIVSNRHSKTGARSPGLNLLEFGFDRQQPVHSVAVRDVSPEPC